MLLCRTVSRRLESITKPVVLYSRPEVLSTPSVDCHLCLVSTHGFFKDIPGNISVYDCITKDSLTLLYVGISPDKIAENQTAAKTCGEGSRHTSKVTLKGLH